MNTTITSFGFIGLGLIGGSIARAIREKMPDSHIVAYDINRDTLNAASSEHIADVVTDCIDASFADCDYVFLCAPVRKNEENLQAVKKVISNHCLLTDVGSVKTGIHNAIERAGLEKQFIGGHPMAGSERVGFLNAKTVLLQDAYYILTPTASVSPEKVDAYQNLVKTLGAIPLVLNYEQHDLITAAISHLPHVIAASLVNLVRDRDSEDGIMKMVAAGGFKDITRIASSSPVMWQQICLTNTENIKSMLSDYIQSLLTVQKQIENLDADALYEFFDGARIYRDSFINASSGPIKKNYSFNVDISDETGALASITTMLALNGISIKNVGIVHNREAQNGVLRIEFYEETAVLKAQKLLQDKNYVVYTLN
ncbi:MAG: prephenate dehydrogenase [Bacteroidales bacterium]|nr:prephenate dehydrogenase [Lachnoclostridium sp.]MCM1383003.1 prephenate dehydrogenase [Lachnoclostridium sp.]MCM1463943.1 prephenate dehydrogenase [Bacteroidales bacterium]